MAEPGDGATLRTYLVVLRRRKWWVIALALLGLAASLALSLTEPKQYSATAQLLVQSSGQGISLGSAPQQVTTTDVQTDLQLATSAPVITLVTREAGQRSRHLRLRGGPDQRDRADRDQLQPGPGRAHRQHLRQGVRRADPEDGHQEPDHRLDHAASADQCAGQADQVAAGPGQQRHPGQRSGQPAGRAEGRGRPASGQRGRRHERGRVRHPGPGSHLAQFAEADPGRPAGAGRRADAGPGRRLPAGQPRRRAVLQGSGRAVRRSPGHRDGPDGELLAEAEPGRGRLQRGAHLPGRRGLPVAADLAPVRPAGARAAHAAGDQPGRRGREDVHPGQPGRGVRPGRRAGGPGFVRPAPTPAGPVLRHRTSSPG